VAFLNLAGLPWIIEFDFCSEKGGESIESEAWTTKDG
jgi:hypothetical protein